MRLFIRNLVLLTFLLFCFHFFPSPVSAATTPFRSAGTVTTDGFIPYTNLNNCQQTDGLTCDRASGPLFGNLIFTNFGTYHDFGMPDGSTITRLYMRVTGKSTRGLFGGSINNGNCDFFTTIFTFTGLVGTTLRTQTISNPVNSTGLDPSVKSFCYLQSTFESGRTLVRLNQSTDSTVNWSASIDNLEIAFDYTPPVVTPTPTKTPLVFIPGIGGSELKVNNDTLWGEPDGHGGTFAHEYLKDEKIWVNSTEALKPGNDDYFDILRMNFDGTSQANIGITGDIFPGAYQGAINFFLANGYELNKTLFPFAYDWRHDVADAIPLLDQKIASIKQQTGSQKVDIVAHSMGGLVARSYIVNSERANNIRKLINLGTPHLGAVQSINAIINGDCLTDSHLADLPICIGLAQSEVRDVIQNMISEYELTPSHYYYNFYNNSDIYHPYPFRNEAGPLTFEQIKSLLSEYGYNISLLAPSEAFHALDSTLTSTNDVDVTNIAGSGEPTLGQIIDFNIIDFAGVTIKYKEEVAINGDKTVPLYSASLIDPQRNISFLGNAKVFYTKQDHGGLAAPGAALNLVKNLLSGSTQIPTGVATVPYLLSGYQLSVHSPVNIHVYDANGNHTGPVGDGDFEEAIPGSSYDTIDDAKFVFLPDDGEYSVRFEATGKGKFDFKIRTFANDVNSDTKIYKDLPLTTTTHGQTTFDTTSTEPPVIALDYDNNGIVDQEVSLTSEVAGSEVADQTAPITEVSFDGEKGNNGWFKGTVTVALNATDNNSGVAKTEYTLDNGLTINEYSSPFSITNDGIYRLKYKSTDNAGNEEPLREIEIKIDSTPPEARLSINKDTHEVDVVAIDDNPTVVNKVQNTVTNTIGDWLYTLSDEAGNTLKIDERNLGKNNIDGFTLYSLQYDQDPPIIQGNNSFTVTYQGKKELTNLKEQRLDVKGVTKARIQYDAKKDISKISIQDGNSEKIKESRNGLVVLISHTNGGSLGFGY